MGWFAGLDGLVWTAADDDRHMIEAVVNQGRRHLARTGRREDPSDLYMRLLRDRPEDLRALLLDPAKAGLAGLPLRRGQRSRAVIERILQGLVVVQFTGPEYRPRHPVLQADPIASTPETLKIVNDQQPELAPRLLYHMREEVMVTEYRHGVHPAPNETAEDPVIRPALRRLLPDTLAAIARLGFPRAEKDVDSFVRVVKRASDILRTRGPTVQAEAALFGVTPELLGDLGERAASMTPRTASPQHNDIHGDNVLLEFRVDEAGCVEPSRLTVLDWQTPTIADPLQDVALAAVKFRYGPEETAELVERWAALVGPERSAGAHEDIALAKAVMGATQAIGVVPGVHQAISEAVARREIGGAELDRLIDAEAARVHDMVGPALAYVGNPVDPAWARNRLTQDVPGAPTRRPGARPAVGRSAAATALTGVGPAAQLAESGGATTPASPPTRGEAGPGHGPPSGRGPTSVEPGITGLERER